MRLYNPETIGRGCHTYEIEPANKNNKILLEQALHHMHISLLTGVDIADSVIRGSEKLLTSDIDNGAYYIGDKKMYSCARTSIALSK